MKTEIKHYEIIVSKKATQMLLSHVAFLSQVSVEAANKLIDDFEKAILTLEQMPHRCPLIKGEYIPQNIYRYLLIDKYYMLIFKIQDNKVFCDYVIDARQDYKWLLK